MPFPHASGPKRESSGSQPAAPRADDLIRSLIALLAGMRNPMTRASSANLEEIIFDGEVEGFRYLLVRLPPSDLLPTNLSPREQEIVRMVAQGHPNKIIAAVLNISSWTVCTHLRRIFLKLGVTSRAAMVARLLEQEVIHVRTKFNPEPGAATASPICDPTVPGAPEPNLPNRLRRREPLPRRAG